MTLNHTEVALNIWKSQNPGPMKLVELNIFVIHKTPQIAVCNILTCCCRAPEQQNLLVTSGVLQVRAFVAEKYL